MTVSCHFRTHAAQQIHVLFGSPNDHLTNTRYLTAAYALGIGREPIEALDIHADSLRLLTDRRKFAVCLDHPLGNYPMRAIGTSWHDRRPSGECLLRPDPFGDVELHSAAECFIAQMRICDLRVRIVRDGHEPNEAEEQRPGCVPIEPVHVISSPKDRREQEGYQNSGSFGENRWGDLAGITTIFRAGAYPRGTCSRAPVSHGNDSLASPSASTIAVPSTFCDTVPDGETSRTRSSNRLPCAKIPVIMPPPCAQARS